MDTIIQLKSSLISRIQNSKDLNFLKALQTIFEASDTSLYKLTKEQKETLDISRKQIANGDYIENGKAISEMKTWLKNQ